MRASILRHHSPSRRLGAAGIGLALVAGSLLGASATQPAQADVNTVQTINSSSIIWGPANIVTGTLHNGFGFRADPGLVGWTFSAFQEIGTLSLSRDGVGWEFAADTHSVNTRVGGKSVITLTGNTGETFAEDYTVTLTLTIEGNYARWSYSIAGDNADTLTATFAGAFAARHTSVIEATATTLLAHNVDASGPPAPITGISVTSNGSAPTLTSDSDSGEFSASTTGAGSFEVTALLVDYPVGAPSSLNAALAFTRPLLANIDAHFGETHLAPGAPVSFQNASVTQGTPVDTELTTTIGEELIDMGYFLLPGLDATARATGLPAGLTLTTIIGDKPTAEEDAEPEVIWPEEGEEILPVPRPALDARVAADAPAEAPISFRLSGTATTPGVYTVPVTIYLAIPKDAFPGTTDGQELPFPQPIGVYPLDTTLTVTVAPRVSNESPTPTAPAETPGSTATPTGAAAPPVGTPPGTTPGSARGGSSLPTTGGDFGALALPIGLLAAAGAVLLMGARRRRTAE
ncbi:hypothetical protein [Mycetocola saprophilus]|uniref:hypothetical protein n=1 Tax=Mycetocola saprophilus TaxID=76636 RepID=UPI003BEFE539